MLSRKGKEMTAECQRRGNTVIHLFGAVRGGMRCIVLKMGNIISKDGHFFLQVKLGIERSIDEERLHKVHLSLCQIVSGILFFY